tara:strand:+ start:1301 stop:1906 length:606 start_codon:yes stop_codon:yes gene_type:complete
MALNFCNNNSLSAITSIPAAITGGSLNLISTQTASDSSTLSFTSGIDSTYKEYVFKFINIHPGSAQYFTFQGSTDGGSNYNTTITSTAFDAYHMEDASAQDLRYLTGGDLAESTSFQPIYTVTPNTDNDASASGFLHLFDPSNTTFVKHFFSTMSIMTDNPAADNYFVGGKFNTTSAINAVQFKLASGNIGSGVIKLYGVS